MHYENEQDKERLLKVTIGGHPNGTLMVANDKVAEALEGEFKPCCFFGAMISPCMMRNRRRTLPEAVHKKDLHSSISRIVRSV